VKYYEEINQERHKSMTLVVATLVNDFLVVPVMGTSLTSAADPTTSFLNIGLTGVGHRSDWCCPTANG
jgi:hypothetical protein